MTRNSADEVEGRNILKRAIRSLGLGGCIGAALLLFFLLFNETTGALLLSSTGRLGSGPLLFVRVLNVVCLVLGGLLLWGRPPLKFRHLVFIAIPTLVALCFTEIFLRFYMDVIEKQRRTRDLEQYLGWALKENATDTRETPGYDKVTFHTGPGGFRLWGDLTTTGPRLMVLGDSFTHAHTVNDGEAYYDVIKQNFPHVEVFAYGNGGFGTLQEYLVLDRYFDQIKPTLVLWQFTDNDLINNSYDLEIRSRRHNNMMTRPYWRDGRIQWLHPHRYGGALDALIRNVYLFRLFDIQLRIIRAELTTSVEDELFPTHPWLLESRRITAEVLRMVEHRVGSVPVVGFCAIEPEFAPGLIKELCDEAGITYIPGVAEAVAEAKARGEQIDGHPYDLHWNASGNRLVGNLISKHLQNMDLLSTSPHPLTATK